MRTATVVEVLNAYEPNDIIIKAYDDIFGDYEIRFTKWHYRIVDGVIIVKDDNVEYHYEFGSIRDIRLVATEEQILAYVAHATSIYDAWRYAKDNLTPNVENALNDVQERLQPSPKKQEDRFHDLIDTILKRRHSVITKEAVARHILLNTLGKTEITETLPRSVFVRLCDKIDETIEKMEDIPF